jgi:hypothetical protein
MLQDEETKYDASRIQCVPSPYKETHEKSCVRLAQVVWIRAFDCLNDF